MEDLTLTLKEGLCQMKRIVLASLLTAFAIHANAATKVFIDGFSTNYPSNVYSVATFYDTTSMSMVDIKVIFFPTDNSIFTTDQAIAFVKAAAYTEATAKGYTITDADFIANWPLTGIPSPIPTYTNPVRSLNTAFQISTTQNARVYYAVNIACTLNLTTGQSGSVVMEYADDSSFVMNDVIVQTSTNANTGTLAIGLALNQTVTSTVSGDIPAGKYVRLRTVNNTGTPTFTMGTAQEVLYSTN